MSSPDFQRYLINTLKLSVYGLLWGFPIPILLAFLLNRIESKKIKQKTAYEMRISDWSSDVCSSDLFCRWGSRRRLCRGAWTRRFR